jgi:hypothetical protein
MASTLQLVDTDLSTVLLDLNSTNGDEHGSVTWALLSDVEFSAPTYANDRFNFASADGGTTSSHRAQLSQVTFRVLPTATTYDNLVAGVNRLAALLTNGGTLKWIPNGSSNTRFRDFEPSDSPVLFEGRELGVFNATALFKKPEGVTLQLAVQPFFYGAALDSASNILLNATMLRDIDGDGDPDSWGLPLPVPLTISGLVGWWEADAITGVGDTEAITTWPDQSPLGADLTSSGSPTLQLDEANGLPAVRFAAASSQYFVTTDAALVAVATGESAATPLTVLAVAKPNDTASNKTVVSWAATATNDFANVRLDNAEKQRIARNDGTTTFTSNAATNALSTAAFSVASWVFTDEATGIAHFLNGAANGTQGTLTDLGDVDPARFGIGAYVRTAVADFFDGDIAAVLVYDSALGTTDRETVEGYLGARYGIAV